MLAGVRGLRVPTHRELGIIEWGLSTNLRGVGVGVGVVCAGGVHVMKVDIDDVEFTLVPRPQLQSTRLKRRDW
jgi:hypothetical protein